MLDALKVAQSIKYVTSIGKPKRSKGHWVIAVRNPQLDYIHFTVEENAEEAYVHLNSLLDKSYLKAEEGL